MLLNNVYVYVNLIRNRSDLAKYYYYSWIYLMILDFPIVYERDIENDNSKSRLRYFIREVYK